MQTNNQLSHQFLLKAFEQINIHGFTIANSASNLLGNKNIPLIDEQKSDLRMVETSARHLQYLVGNLVRLDFALLVLQFDHAVFELLLAERSYKNAFNRDFVTTLRYELQTPINSIIGFCQVILEHYRGPLDETHKVEITDIVKRGQILLRIIDQIFAVWRIETYKAGDKTLYMFEQINPREKIEDTINGLGDTIRTRMEIKIESKVLDTLPPIYMDEERIYPIIHLMASILGEDFQQGKLILNIGYNDKEITIIVQNKECILDSSIVEEFNRVKLTSTLFKFHHFDRVLDMAICQALVGMNNGKVELTSQEKEGTVVMLSLPIEQNYFQSAI